MAKSSLQFKHEGRRVKDSPQRVPLRESLGLATFEGIPSTFPASNGVAQTAAKFQGEQDSCDRDAGHIHKTEVHDNVAERSGLSDTGSRNIPTEMKEAEDTLLLRTNLLPRASPRY